MTAATAATTTEREPALNLCGTRPGDECWLVRTSDPHPPIHCPIAVLVRDRLAANVVLVFAGQTWGAHEVFTSEAEAAATALRSARWNADYYRKKATDAERALEQLTAGNPAAVPG